MDLFFAALKLKASEMGDFSDLLVEQRWIRFSQYQLGKDGHYVSPIESTFLFLSLNPLSLKQFQGLL